MRKYRIKKITYSDGRVCYVPQQKIFFLWFCCSTAYGVQIKFCSKALAESFIEELAECCETIKVDKEEIINL